MQNFEFSKIYSCIWNQWVLEYLIDDDLLAYLKKCVKYLHKDGAIFAKENISNKSFFVDKSDCCIFRTDSMYRKIFKESGLEVKDSVKQTGFPEDLHDVLIYCLKPL